MYRYLSLYTPTPPVTPRSEVTVKWDDLFKQYAIEYWPLHWQNIKTDQISRRTGEKLRIFLFESGELSPSFTNWVSAAGKLSRFGSHPWDGRKVFSNELSSSPPTPLFLACFFGLDWITHELSISENVKWNRQDKAGQTALQIGASRGHENMVRLLLENGADIVAGAKYGWTALHSAAINGHDGVVRLLLETGADIEAKANEGSTTLHYAARDTYGECAEGCTSCEHKAVVRLLLEKGADIEAMDNRGRSALYNASRCQHREVVQVLL